MNFQLKRISECKCFVLCVHGFVKAIFTAIGTKLWDNVQYIVIHIFFARQWSLARNGQRVYFEGCEACTHCSSNSVQQDVYYIVSYCISTYIIHLSLTLSNQCIYKHVMAIFTVKGAKDHINIIPSFYHLISDEFSFSNFI